MSRVFWLFSAPLSALVADPAADQYQIETRGFTEGAVRPMLTGLRQGRDFGLQGHSNDANLVQTSPLSSGRDSARGLALLPFHAQPAGRRGDVGASRS